MSEEPFNGWAVVELMGHRVVAGHVSQARIAGNEMLRVDIHWRDPARGIRVTQFYSGAAIYCLTPCSEEEARKQAGFFEPSEFEVRQLRPGEEDDDE